MNKRIIALGVSAAAVVGLGATALAASAEPPTGGLDQAAIALASDPVPPGPTDPKARRQQLKACVKAKVDGGAQRRVAVKDCATQLGIKPGAGRLHGAVHAELVVPKKGAAGQFETVQLDRGKVTTASATSVSLQRPDGPTVTVKVVAGTKVKGAASAADLAAGRQIVVVSAAGEARSIVAKP